MKRKVLLVILAMSLVSAAWGGVGLAGQIGYSLKASETGFGFKPEPGVPSSGVMAADGLIGRPLGLATTIAGTGIFIITLPASLITHSTDEAAWGLVGRPGAWTFNRPLGRGNPEFEERPIFRP
jgi:hypothetical protein